MIKRRMAEHGGFRMEVEYIVLNDGGEPRVIAWEVSPGDAPPDIILDKALEHETFAERVVDGEIKSHMAGLIRNTIVCHNCED